MQENKKVITDIKNQMLKSESYLNEYATKSCDAIRFKEEKSDIRLNYARDIDRIIHSSSYTRYIDKTQVYSYISNDNISKRMTHVQFVSRAAKTIARSLGLNEDLCDAMALGHDVGHVPFGHFGEAILDDISQKRTGKCFAHNLNSVRVFKDIEKRGLGCNLTLQTLDGIMCHNGELLQKEYRPVKKDKEIFLKEYEECRKDSSKIKKLVPMTLEGCVVRISDIIGYIGKDIEDSKRLSRFNVETIPDEIKNVLGVTNDQIMNNIIMDIVTQSYGKDYIQMSENVYEQVKNLKKFNYENIYYKAYDEKFKEKIKDMFYKLYDVYIKALENEEKENDIYKIFLDKMDKKYLENSSNDEKVIDYIASMTDNFIKRQYNKYVVR